MLDQRCSWFAQLMRWLTFVFTALVAACASESVFGVVATGEPGRVEWMSSQSAGGQIFQSRLTVDSASGTYAILRCRGSVIGECAPTEQRTGNVPPAVLQLLFERAQSKEFRELRSEYRIHDDVMPPDGGWTRLTIVVGERRKTVEWDFHVTVPQILGDYGCLMLAATESLLCD